MSGEELRGLAERCGIQASYRDVRDQEVEASDESLAAALEALGVQDGTIPWEDDPGVVVAWDGKLPRGSRATVVTEDGEEADPSAPLPPGYHELHHARGEPSLVISAPARLPRPEGHSWGLFVPLYAVRSGRDWGTGDLTDLRELIEWTASLGGGIVATLPMLAQFYTDPFEPSPYSPVSRLYANELYVDPLAAPEVDTSDEARRILADRAFADSLERLRSGDLVDYRAAAAAKRRVLEPMSQTFFAAPPQGFRRHLEENPDLETYARFRATCEEHAAGWPAWPDDALVAVDDPRARYHLYAQWLAHEQLEAVGAAARERGSGLYLDMPLGVSGGGYDVWRYRESFALGASGGAPPDAFFTQGQDWGFPPLHPHRIRSDRYRYVRATVAYLLRYATLLRVDHVMWLHRLFWVPEGLDPSQGVYVTYPAEELYAILLLEAARAGASVVGEDLGTVPPEVTEGMDRRGLHHSYVVQY
ncbi:MAG TPA: 4-alpha-glucanotransferase, partial [Actinomycetota bacterium]|nr:4-alpha-glucanotransferase [Actinomycetota bacterium]